MEDANVLEGPALRIAIGFVDVVDDVEALDNLADDDVARVAVRSAGVEGGLGAISGRDEELRADLIVAVVDKGNGGPTTVFDARSFFGVDEGSLERMRYRKEMERKATFQKHKVIKKNIVGKYER